MPSTVATGIRQIAVYSHGAAVDDPLLRLAANDPRYYHGDGLGSITAVSNGKGEIVASNEYDHWGNITASTGTTPQFGYTGREPDATGLVYYRNRYYDPQIGRFTQLDPKGFIDGINRYAYVMNSPVNYVDPWGLSASGRTVDFNSAGYFSGSNVGYWSGNSSVSRGGQSSLATTFDAVDHYFFGNGESVELSDSVKNLIMNHPDVQNQTYRNEKGLGEPPYRIDLDLTFNTDTFHIGKMKVVYTELCSNTTCTTTYTAPVTNQRGEPDGFDDPLNIGLEIVGGDPYKYKTFSWSVSYPKSLLEAKGDEDL